MLLLIGPASREEGLPERELPFVESLRDEVRDSGMDGTVVMTGRMNNVHEYMAAADLFVFLSRQEGLGIVTQEAMACGLPCILSPLDGIAEELIDNGETGFIINNPDCPDSVAATMSRLLSNQPLRARLGQQARRSAVERFSFEARATALADLYRELTERRHR